MKLSVVFMLSFVLFPLALAAQTIEVEVTDTIHVAPDIWTYLLTINREEVDQFESLAKQTEILEYDQLEQIIKNDSEIFILKEDPIASSSIFSEGILKSVIIKTTSRSSLMNFLNEIEKYSNVSGNILEMKTIESSSKKRELKKRLLDKSRKEGSVTAGLLNKKLGEIISVSETQAEDLTKAQLVQNNEFTLYPPLSMLSKAVGTSKGIDKYIVLKQTITVVYEMR